ncbi:alkene reductase [Pseudomonas sp. GL-B-19]|uniref:alkene reductase n=1 Tax=Pseudomonas sp. GL-B-19 TaxID=2832393 RepID=UPI001CBF8ADE|nr:alkene reductase [Pseudomonas sp. GL-B-19]
MIDTTSSKAPLFQPTLMGDLELPNRIVMSPLTRMRAANPGLVPTELHAEYYAQRASAGLIISEGASISPEAVGWADTPGLWSKEQLQGWSHVLEAVHAKGGRMVAQLWHTGAISHPDFGAAPMSASDVNIGYESTTPLGRKPTVAPRPMTLSDIHRTVSDYAKAARNAMSVGFDGVQIQANYLYLIAQFLNRTTNLRTDEYGGSIEKRARFLFEVIEAVLQEVDPRRVGVRIGPMNEVGAFAANDETLPMAEYAIRELSDYGLSHALIMGATTDFAGTSLEPLAGDAMFRHLRSIFKGTLIANVGMDAERGNRLIAEGSADLIAFGRPFISNPDLVERLAVGAPLAEIDWNTVYASGARGYTDYPRHISTAVA